MSTTFESDDWLIVKPLGPQDVIRPRWIVAFWYQGERNVKRVVALPGQLWEGKLVPPGYLAIQGDCSTTSMRIPPIPREWVYGVVTGVRYNDFWVAPDGCVEKAGETKVVVPDPQPAKNLEGVKFVRVDRNANPELINIGIPGDVRKYYPLRSTIIEESTSKVYKVTDVGLDTSKGKDFPTGMTRLLTEPHFDSAATGGRVVLLAPGAAPPKDIAKFFKHLL